MTVHRLLEHFIIPERGIDLGLGSTLHTRYRVTRDEFDEFITTLQQQEELTLCQVHSIDKNVAATFQSGTDMICITHTARDSMMRILCDKTEVFSPLPLQPQQTTAITPPHLCLLPLDYTHREMTDGNGMGYALILPDGRYIVYDGGYRVDAPGLLHFLKEHNRHPDGKIVIAAWIFTHAHADHYGAFRAIAETHADKITLEAAVFNPILQEMLPRGDGYNPYFAEELRRDLARFGQVKCYRPHTGQVLYFGEVPLEILYTYEHYLPGNIPNANDSSIASRLTLNGQTLLFMGDCERTTSDLICDLYENALRSDVVQVNHHGYSGGTTELYQKIAPAFALWPTNKITFDLRVTGIKYQFIGNAVNSNKYLFDTLGAHRCLISDQAALYPLPLK